MSKNVTSKVSLVGGNLLSRAELKKVMGGTIAQDDQKIESCIDGMYPCYCTGIFRECAFGYNHCYYICNP